MRFSIAVCLGAGLCYRRTSEAHYHDSLANAYLLAALYIQGNTPVTMRRTTFYPMKPQYSPHVQVYS